MVRNSERERLPKVVAESLVDMIAARELQPGDALPSESQLAEQFSVSKPTVRQALSHLAAFGIVQIQQGKPSTVQSLGPQPLQAYYQLAVRATDDGLREALELRRVVEVGLAELAATSADAAGKARLEAALAQMRAAMREFDGWIAADLEFHTALACCTGNALLTHTVIGLRDVMRYTMRSVAAQVDLRNVGQSCERHAAICRAVLAGDPEAARTAMQAHFDATKDIVAAIAADNSRLKRF